MDNTKICENCKNYKAESCLLGHVPDYAVPIPLTEERVFLCKHKRL